jgi:hypothetical protein
MIYCMYPVLPSRYRDGLRTEQQEFDSQQRQEIASFSTASRQTLGPTRPPIELIQGAEVKNRGAMCPSLNIFLE